MIRYADFVPTTVNINFMTVLLAMAQVYIFIIFLTVQMENLGLVLSAGRNFLFSGMSRLALGLTNFLSNG
jgi:hypothetical protein